MKSEDIISDCVEFKHKLHRDAYKKSGARNMNEYIEHVNKVAKKLGLCKKQNNELAITTAK